MKFLDFLLSHFDLISIFKENSRTILENTLFFLCILSLTSIFDKSNFLSNFLSHVLKNNSVQIHATNLLQLFRSSFDYLAIFVATTYFFYRFNIANHQNLFSSWLMLEISIGAAILYMKFIIHAAICFLRPRDRLFYQRSPPIAELLFYRRVQIHC